MFWNKNKQSGGVTESTVTNVLHAMELGAWAKYIKSFLFLLVVFGLLLLYMSNQFRGLEMGEAIDNAQLARNLVRPWLGAVTKQTTVSLAGANRSAAEVVDVRPESPAQRAGVQVGDAIIRWNKADVLGSDALDGLVRQSKVGAKVSLGLVRNGQEASVTMKLASEGFTTKFIRPVSAQKFYQLKGDAKLKDLHPDVFNAPLFPYVLATVFKFHPPSFEVKPVANQPYTKYPPETLIVATCEVFYLLSVGLLYLLGRQLFDKRIAMLAMVIFIFSDLLWRYSISGLPTTMLLFLFLAAQVCMVNAHLVSAQSGSKFKIWGLAAAAGLFCGLCLLTKYSAGWLIVPVLAYVGLTLGKDRWIALALVFIVFVIVVSPWLARNEKLTGKWFGLAGYSVIEQTDRYPNDQLERSFGGVAEPSARNAQKKLLVRGRQMVESGWLKTGGGLVSVFFLVGLLYRFKKAEVLTYRRFVLGAFVLAAIVSCLGSVMTSSKDNAADPSSLTVLLCPGMILISAAFFFLLFDRVDLKIPLLKYGAIGLFVIICVAPLIFSLLPPRRNEWRYPSPPYYEPSIAQVSKWIDPRELMMSDMPWAVAWYGDRKCVWLPNELDEFYQINDLHMRVSGLYLTKFSLSLPFNEMRLALEQARQSQKPSWATLFVGQIPNDFPLKSLTPVPPFVADMLFLSDRPRWQEEKK